MTTPANPRARDLDVPFEGTPGPLNAITDVAGVEVGHATLIRGEGKLVVGQGPVRTGVTAVLPRGKASLDPVFAAWYPLNGNGELTGAAWIDESGLLEGPLTITNTHSVGVVRDAVVQWLVERDPTISWALPVVTETYDGFLNDINGFHVQPEHVFAALASATVKPASEGNVGSGTGMRAFGFKAGIGTASRAVSTEAGSFTVGVLVQANYGKRDQLLVAGIPIGREIPDLLPIQGDPSDGSAVVVVATDAPLLPHQLRRLAKRAALGLARTGGIAENTSGDLVVAFSTAARGLREKHNPVTVEMLPNDQITPLFAATVQATEESVVNALVAARTLTGINGRTVFALPHDRLREALRKYNRTGRDGVGKV
jgi:L-aminopeptidase/D-esterase-like protein